MDILKDILTGGVGSIGLLVSVLILNKAGILDKLIKRNGIGKVEEELKQMKENHLHTLENKLDEQSRQHEKQTELLVAIKTILENK